MNLCHLIDLTLLSSDTTSEQISALCDRAMQYSVAAVCVDPCWVPLCRDILSENKTIKIATVCNFPTGMATLTQVKTEIDQAILHGVDELDIVIPYQALQAQETALVQQSIAAYRDCSKGYTLKVIIESGLLTTEEIEAVSLMCVECGVDFIKTATGKAATGATLDAASIILQSIKKMGAEETTGIKLSGGIRTVAQAEDYLRLIQQQLGEAWISAKHCRFGASSLLDDIISTESFAGA